MTGQVNQIQPGWDSFDIDYPISIRVIGNTNDGQEKCVSDVKRFYPHADAATLWEMLSRPGDYFWKYRRNIVVMQVEYVWRNKENIPK